LGSEINDLAMLLCALIASDGKQILVITHQPTYLKSRVCFIAGRNIEKDAQSADGSLTAGSPAQRSPEPALLLLLGPLDREPSRAGSAFFTPRSCAARSFFGEKTSIARAISGLARASLMFSMGHPGCEIGGWVRTW